MVLTSDDVVSSVFLRVNIYWTLTSLYRINLVPEQMFWQKVMQKDVNYGGLLTSKHASMVYHGKLYHI